MFFVEFFYKKRYIIFMTGKEFKLKRVVLDMTQAELASELDLNPNTVSRYENEDLPISKTVELAMETLECRQKESEKVKTV